MQVGITCNPRKHKYKDIIKKHPGVAKWLKDVDGGALADFSTPEDFFHFATAVDKNIRVSKALHIPASSDGAKKPVMQRFEGSDVFLIHIDD